MSVGLAIILGALISAFAVGGGALYSNAANKKNQQKAYEQQKDLMKYEQQLNQQTQDRTYRMYNSPTAQRAAMQAAGLNPFATGSAIQPMTASSPEVSGGTPPGFQPTQNPFSGFQSLADSFSSGASMHQQQKLLDAQVAETNAKTNKTLLESQALQNTLDLKEYTDQIVKNAALSGQLKNKMDKFHADILKVQADNAPEEQKAKIAEIWAREKESLERAAKTREEKEIVSRMAKFVEEKEQSEIDLNKANANLANQQVNQSLQTVEESKSRQSLNEVDAETRRQTRDAIVREAKAKAALAEADEALIEDNREARKKQNELNNWLADQKMQRKPTESYYEMALAFTDRYLEYRGQNIEKNKESKENKSLFLGLVLRYIIAKGL